MLRSNVFPYVNGGLFGSPGRADVLVGNANEKAKDAGVCRSLAGHWNLCSSWCTNGWRSLSNGCWTNCPGGIIASSSIRSKPVKTASGVPGKPSSKSSANWRAPDFRPEKEDEV